MKFKGPKWAWIRPTTYKELLKLKADFQDAPVIMGNTTAGNIKADDTHFEITSKWFITLLSNVFENPFICAINMLYLANVETYNEIPYSFLNYIRPSDNIEI